MAVYEYRTRIRYDEIDSNGRLTEMALIGLFQNCSTFQSEDLGVGVEYLRERHRAWVVSSWQFHIKRRPALGEEVILRTWSYGIRKALGSRNFHMLDTKGNSLIEVDSLWAYIDTDNMTMVPCPKEESDLYGITPRLDMPATTRKINMPEVMLEGESSVVKAYFIDTNRHMNNAKYLMLAIEYLPEGFEVNDIKVEYKKSAFLGDVIYTRYGLEKNESGETVSLTVSMVDKEGNVYCNAQFT